MSFELQLLDHKQDTEPELLELERADVHSSAEDDDMASQLNPDAKEFIPTSPQRSSPLSPMSNGGSASILNSRPDLLDDDVLAQSPRKGAVQPMDEALPSEDDFSEISKRPAELVGSPVGRESANGFNSNDDLEHRPESSNSQCSYQEMNLKEKMHGDEKQEFAAEIHDNGVNLLETEAVSEPVVEVNDFPYSFREQDPMNMSFYKDENPFNTSVDLNSVRALPDSEDEAENHQNEVTVVEKKEERNLLDNYVSEPVDVDLSVLNNSGAHFIIQDTEFGMHQQNAEANDNMLKAEEDMYPGNTPDLLETIKPEADNEQIESDKPESELSENVEKHSSITQVVQEMASEVTSILNEFTASDANIISQSPVPSNEDIGQRYDEQPQTHGIETGFDDVINSIPFETNQVVHSEAALDFLPESDAKSAGFQESFTSEPVVPLIEAEQYTTLAVEPVVVPAVHVEEPKPSDNNVELLAAASVAATTAVAAAAATVASTRKSPKPGDVKKTEVKKQAAPATKKPTTAAVKSTTKTTTGPAAKAASPTKTIAAKATTLSAAPRPRTAPAKSPIDKKPATATSITKKPLTNGVASATTVKKTTTVTKTSTVGAARPAVSATKTSSITSATRNTAAAAKPATTTARVPLSAR